MQKDGPYFTLFDSSGITIVATPDTPSKLPLIPAASNPIIFKILVN